MGGRMNDHKNKHIRAAVDYALEHGWRLVLAGPRGGSGARCIVHTKAATAVFGGFSARRAYRRTMPGGMRSGVDHCPHSTEASP